MSDMHPQSVSAIPDAGPPAAHELSDLKVGGMLVFLIGLVVVTILVLVLVAVTMMVFRGVEKKDEALRPVLFKDDVGQFPLPRLQEKPRMELSEMKKADREATESYGWVDRKSGIARIPVNQAIDILAEKGLPKGKNIPPKGSRTRDQP